MDWTDGTMWIRNSVDVETWIDNSTIEEEVMCPVVML